MGHNLFKAELPPIVSNKSIPKWVREKLNINPNEKLYQFRFSAEETKARRPVWSVVPNHLVPVLEEYLEKYRPLLLADKPDPHTLFLNRKGGPLTKAQVGRLVSNLTLKYVGRRLNPHMFRDVFAHYALNHHPEKLVAASKHLWHIDPTMTATIYGWMFDEIEALCQVEDWLVEPEPPQQPPQEKSETKNSNAKNWGFVANWHNPENKKAA